MREGVGWKVGECQNERSWLEGRKASGCEKEIVGR